MADLLSSSLFPAAARQRRDSDFHGRRPKLQPLPASSLLPLLGTLSSCSSPMDGAQKIFPAPSPFIILPAGQARCSPTPWRPCNIPLPPPRLPQSGHPSSAFPCPSLSPATSSGTPSQGQRPYSLSRQRSSSQPSFPRSPSTSMCRRYSTECPWQILCCTQQPRHLRALSARCCVKPSGQHAVDVHRWVAVFAQPQCHRRSPPVRPRRSLFDSASALFSYD
jgi:hypothetical protein